MSDRYIDPIVAFGRFVGSLEDVRSNDFVNVPHSRIADKLAFAEIKAHLLDYYAGVEAVHSFMDANGSVFDCIPVESQFSLRGHQGAIARASDLPLPAEPPRESGLPDRPIVQLNSGLIDRLGNRMAAPRGTIPVYRLTFDHLARFRNLSEFFGRTSAAGGAAPAAAQVRKHAFGVQQVANVGGTSVLNLWTPAVGTGALNSISQQWYSAGPQATVQTVECGWQVNPFRYGHTMPVLFVFWTPDGYGTACYNLTCGAFVQTSNKWALGGALAPWSTGGGQQYALRLSYRLESGKWWLYAGGVRDFDAVGYYPTSLFGAGPLATGASQIIFGGETIGTTSCPPMGSGAFPIDGYGFAAYQRGLQYFPTAQTVQDAALAVSISPPTFPPPPEPLYTVSLASDGPPWNETIWLGGPGGSP